jgi:hypothetical protein
MANPPEILELFGVENYFSNTKIILLGFKEFLLRRERRRRNKKKSVLNF